MNLIPMVVERSDDGERNYDIYSRLLQNRIIILNGEINDSVSSPEFRTCKDEKSLIFVEIKLFFL